MIDENTMQPRLVKTCRNCQWRLSLAPICSRCADEIARTAPVPPPPAEPIPETTKD